jgi:BirA family transcriptional regulator, biotin operon repressor / biotin---[acetyl-CoA-carboxylase] ligase
LENNPDLSFLNEGRILRLISRPRLIGKFELVNKVDSTNSYLQKSPKTKGAHICIAEEQTSGKGRRGNRWESGGENIIMSVRRQFESSPLELSNLAIVVGVVVAEALRDAGFRDVMLKWPNDLMARDGKLGGILVESSYDGYMTDATVGIGINAKLDGDVRIGQDYISLAECGEYDRSQIIGEILSRLLPVLDDYNPAEIIETRFPRLDWIFGQNVQIKSNDNEVCGIARGLADDGALMVEVDGTAQKVYSGEVSLRRL